MKASYVIDPRLLTPTINPGERIHVALFVSGSGPVSRNKLVIGYPAAFTDPESPARIREGFHDKDGEAIFSDDYKEDPPWIELPGQHGLLGVFDPQIFQERGVEGEGQLPNVWGEFTRGKEKKGALPPIVLELNSRRKVSPGNHTISFILTYSDEEEVKTDRRTVTFHIRSWVERNGRNTSIIGLVGGIGLAVVGLIVTNL